MLQRHDAITADHSFLVTVVLERGVDPQVIANKLGDALTWVEGTGACDVEHFGADHDSGHDAGHRTYHIDREQE